MKKPVDGEVKQPDLWKIQQDPIRIDKFAKDTADVEKIIWFGESNSGKTRAYLDVLGYYKDNDVPKEQVCMCIVFPDRATE